MYFKVPREVRLNTTHFSTMKIPNKTELQQILINRLSDIEVKHFMEICKKCTAKKYSLLVNDTTLRSDNPLQFRKKSFEINF